MIDTSGYAYRDQMEYVRMEYVLIRRWLVCWLIAGPSTFKLGFALLFLLWIEASLSW